MNDEVEHDPSEPAHEAMDKKTSLGFVPNNVVNINVKGRAGGSNAQVDPHHMTPGPTASVSSSENKDTMLNESNSGPNAKSFTGPLVDKVHEMSMSKDELDAKLGRNKAEVEAIASNMQKEMANFRTSYIESFKDISITLNRLDAKADATEKRLTQAQWVIALVISICAVTLSAVIFFSNKNVKQPERQPAVVVNTSPLQQKPLDPHVDVPKTENLPNK